MQVITPRVKDEWLAVERFDEAGQLVLLQGWVGGDTAAPVRPHSANILPRGVAMALRVQSECLLFAR
jgi:hypothetical protein